MEQPPWLTARLIARVYCMGPKGPTAWTGTPLWVCVGGAAEAAQYLVMQGCVGIRVGRDTTYYTAYSAAYGMDNGDVHISFLQRSWVFSCPVLGANVTSPGGAANINFKN